MLANGILQPSKNTRLVLDEGMMITTRQLRPFGVGAVSALFNLRTQSASCDFKMYQLNYEGDVPVLAVLDKESLLLSDIIIHLQPNQMSVDCFEDVIAGTKWFSNYLNI